MMILAALYALYALYVVFYGRFFTCLVFAR